MDDLSFSDIKKIIGEHMKIALNVDKFDITFAKHETTRLTGDDIWRVNVEYKKEPSTSFLSNTVAITIDAKKGNIISFEKDRIWKF